MESESLALDFRSAFLEAVKERRNAFVCAAAVAIMAIGVFRAPAEAVLLGCSGALSLLIFWGWLKRVLKN
jgi:hypothetical protein